MWGEVRRWLADDGRGGHAWPVEVPKSPSLGERPLVLVLGLPKCGTTSLHEAFKSAGFNSVHWALRVGEDRRADVNLRKYGQDADKRMIARLIYHAAQRELPPLSYLPGDI